MTIKGRCKIIKTYADVVEKYNKIFGKWLFDKIICKNNTIIFI